MNIIKKNIAELEKCYSIAPLQFDGKFHFLVASEKHGACILFDEDGNQIDKVWDEPGGVMTMLQIPGKNGAFLAIHEFYSPNDSQKAKIVIAEPKGNGWDVRTLVKVPFVHRFGILERNGVNYLLICCLKSGHEYKDDWTKPGAVYAAVLPEDLSVFNVDNPLNIKTLKTGMTKNHGYSLYTDNGQDTAIVACQEAVFQFIPPWTSEGEWEIKQLLQEPTSEAVLCDFDGDGIAEMGCISPFHGDKLFICHRNKNNEFEKVWEYPESLEMLHASWVCAIDSKPTWIVGNRKGDGNLRLISYKDGCYYAETIDYGCGSANVFAFANSRGENVIISANRETDCITMYTLK